MQDTALLDDVERIVTAVREVVDDADAAVLSRVVDDEWLEVVAVAGETHGRAATGDRWPRSDLVRDLDQAHRRGRLHVLTRPHESLVLAPLTTRHGDLVGVLAAVAPPGAEPFVAGAGDVVELYADQARLALDLMREHQVLVEHVRISEAAQSIVYDALGRRDVPELLASLTAPLASMMRGGVAWACVQVASGAHAEAASYPGDLAARLDADLCTLLDPLVEDCWVGDATLTDDDARLLRRIAEVVGQERPLLAAIGSGTGARGALLVLRGADDQPWADHERHTLAHLGRRLGMIVEQLETHRRDQHLVDEVRELDQYRRDLVTSLTHDLKTPVTAIALNAELLESDRRLAEADAHHVAAIRRSAARLASMVDDLLALARAEEGMADGRSEDADAAALLREACRQVEVEAQQRGVRFVLALPETLTVSIDGGALARVYVNVVSNAVKFSLPDGEVRIALREVDGSVEMVCADDGIGISESDQAAVFDMLRRSRDAQTRGVPGSGVGLAISQRIVARLGGSIHLASAPGDGSTFTVRVPIR